MAAPPLFGINPPLINSASPWATTLDDLRRLYACPSTGAVTTRTAMINGFDHDPEQHQYVFFDAAHAGAAPNASLNSLGYSPLTLETYLGFLQTISDELPARSPKGFIVSVTGTPEDISASYALLAAAAPRLQFPLAMELNLSCPNIPGRPPPAYSQDALATYLSHLQRAMAVAETEAATTTGTPVPVGLKTPPYTHATQYLDLVSALERAAAAGDNGKATCPISFVTATNTLGSCLLLPPTSSSSPSSPAPSLPGHGTGGMAGAPLHPLALGNVAALRRLLDERAGGGTLGGRRVCVVGVGGVADAAGYRRMRAAGADVVGLATGLGLRGVGVFGEIEAGLGAGW